MKDFLISLPASLLLAVILVFGAAYQFSDEPICETDYECEMSEHTVSKNS